MLVAAAAGHAAERPSQAVEPTDEGLLAARNELHLQCSWLAAAAHFLSLLELNP